MRKLITHTNKCNYTKYGLKTLAINDVMKYIKTRVTRRKDENGIRREFYEIL